MPGSACFSISMVLLLDSGYWSFDGGQGKVTRMTALSTRDKEYLQNVSREIAEKNPEPTGFNGTDDDMDAIEEADEVTAGPSLSNFNGAPPDDRYDITDSILREDGSVLVSESMLACDLGDDETGGSESNSKRQPKRGMRAKTVISRLSDSTSDGNPECLASVDGLLMRIVSVSIDSKGRPVLDLGDR